MIGLISNCSSASNHDTCLGRDSICQGCLDILIVSHPFLPTATSVDKGECVGGSTLSLLHDRSFNYTGDSQAQELCLYLTKAASAPYFEILEKWIYRGIIHDPYR